MGLRQDWLEDVGRRILSLFFWLCFASARFGEKVDPVITNTGLEKDMNCIIPRSFVCYQQCYNKESVVSGSCETSIPVVV